MDIQISSKNFINTTNYTNPPIITEREAAVFGLRPSTTLGVWFKFGESRKGGGGRVECEGAGGAILERHAGGRWDDREERGVMVEKGKADGKSK